MRLMTTRITQERTISDLYRSVSFILSQELTKKALFIVSAAGLLTWIVVYSGTSHTPPVDVFVYCLVYSGWITLCLPWLVQNMTGKILVLIAGVVVRLFAVDVGVLAWSAVRGHRHIFQRGLRLRPLFEPSMSWLAEAGDNLRYGVVMAAIVASLVSLLLDLFDRANKSMACHFRRSAPFRSRNSWLRPQDENPWEDTHATKKPRYEDLEDLSGKTSRYREWGDVHPRESKTSRTGNTVRFNNTDSTDFTGSMKSQRGGERGSQRSDKAVYKADSSSDSDSEEYENLKKKRCQVEREDDCFGGNMRSPKASWKTLDDCEACNTDLCYKKHDSPSPFSMVNGGSVIDEDPPRVFRMSSENVSPIVDARVKNKSRGIRAHSATDADVRRSKPCCESVDRKYVTRSYGIGKPNESDEIKRDAKEVIEDTLNESMLSLRKLRRK